MPDTTFAWIAAGFVVCVIAYFWILRSLFYYLKEQHPIAWRALGSPRLLDNPIHSNWLLLRFIFGREHKRLNDPGVDHRAIALRIMLLAIVVLMAVALFRDAVR